MFLFFFYRSQTLATMDEASFQRMAAVVASQTMAASSPSKSSERLIDGRKTPEFELYSQIFPRNWHAKLWWVRIFFKPFYVIKAESQKLFKSQDGFLSEWMLLKRKCRWFLAQNLKLLFLRFYLGLSQFIFS